VVGEDICWMSATEMAPLIASRALSPVEATRSLLDRIEAVNPAINAYVTVVGDLAMDQARAAEEAVMLGRELGPLHGVPLAIKDTNYTKGVRTTLGSRLLEDFVPQEDSVNVHRLRKAGAIFLGKTNTPEFAGKAVTENLLFGVTRNPWDRERTVGGSSGGAAAAVAAGLAPAGTASDGGGSIRIPASCCGVFGIKPQFGRIPNYPVFHLWEHLLHEGAVSRTVADAALMMDVMSGPHWGDRHSIPVKPASFRSSLTGDVRGMKVAWSPDLGFASVSAAVRAVCEAAVVKLSELGAIVEEVDLPFFRGLGANFSLCFSVELAAMLTTFGPFEEIQDKLHPIIAERAAKVQDLSAIDYLKATFQRRDLAAKLGEFLLGYDCLVTPTIGIPAWPIGLPNVYVDEVDGKPVANADWILAFPFNMTGNPAASVPAGWTGEGLPVGLQIVGRSFDEASVFRASAALEEANPWATRRPPFSSRAAPTAGASAAGGAAYA
jgi:aspartyl-tRNA(Asn)/glutamyl-tRNA(Gln) amidotransferase subunit A